MSVRSCPWVLAMAAGIVTPSWLAAQDPLYESPPENLPRAVDPQPVPFDHKLHMGLRMTCMDCHPGALERERAGLPDRDRCMLCHQSIAKDRAGVQELAAMAPGTRIRWERVYRVPDFVFFSHSEHASAGLACADCHGPVETRRVLHQELSTNMVACMNCHAERQASNECYLCHDLGQ